MPRDIIVTTPLHKRAAAAEEGWHGVEGGDDAFYFRTFRTLPPGLEVGSLVFYVEAGYIRGFARVKKIVEGTMECATTGKPYHGFHAIMPVNTWYWIRPIAMRGFQGWRYMALDAEAIHAVGSYKSARPIPSLVYEELQKKMPKVSVTVLPFEGSIDALSEPAAKQLIFALTGNDAETVAAYLTENVPMVCSFIHGAVPQKEQKYFFDFFQERRSYVHMVTSSPFFRLPKSPHVAVLRADHPTRDAESLMRMALLATERVTLFANKITSAMQLAFPDIHR